MSFFIPERTRCPICEQAIARRIDAVQPHWVHPEDVGELAVVGRRFVHHVCWRTWEHRETFTAAARALRLRAVGEEPLIEQAGVFLYQHGASFSIEDVALPISLSIDSTENPLVPNWLIGVLSNGPPHVNEPANVLVIRMHSLSASWLDDDELDITLGYDGEPTQRFTLSAPRRAAWLAVLRVAVARV